ncbi:hypothetical protein EGR_08717 [Echinococcus granulosus]|uniref:Link domain-containing protein n=1 Tax=Echinococcus granulosus TaxID=6210 RepID=W6U5F0_ECHGR|nr:hypothetical protein EGR_08717 [Echinococcus granulosus]EUB56403.1 hypothetical protein EGR_08717 [Echinococcus granulosus]
MDDHVFGWTAGGKIFMPTLQPLTCCFSDTFGWQDFSLECKSQCQIDVRCAKVHFIMRFVKSYANSVNPSNSDALKALFGHLHGCLSVKWHFEPQICVMSTSIPIHLLIETGNLSYYLVAFASIEKDLQTNLEITTKINSTLMEDSWERGKSMINFCLLISHTLL